MNEDADQRCPSCGMLLDEWCEPWCPKAVPGDDVDIGVGDTPRFREESPPPPHIAAEIPQDVIHGRQRHGGGGLFMSDLTVAERTAVMDADSLRRLDERRLEIWEWLVNGDVGDFWPQCMTWSEAQVDEVFAYLKAWQHWALYSDKDAEKPTLPMPEVLNG